MRKYDHWSFLDCVWQCDLRERTLSYDHTINQRHPHAVSLTIPPPPPCSCPLCRILGHDRPGWCYLAGEVSQFRGDHLMQQRSSCTFASRSRYQEHHHHELASAEEAQRSRPLCLDVYSVRKMKWRIGLMPDILKRIRHQRATSFSRAVSSPE